MKIEEIEVTEATIGKQVTLSHLDLIVLKNELKLARDQRQQDQDRSNVYELNIFDFIDKICMDTPNFEESRNEFFKQTAIDNADQSGEESDRF